MKDYRGDVSNRGNRGRVLSFKFSLAMTLWFALFSLQVSAAKEHEKEIKEYQKLLETSPDDLDASFRMGTLYAWQGDHNEAIEVFEGILAKEPRYVDAEVAIARVYAWKGDNLLAKARFEEIIRKYPRNLEAHQGLASLYLWNNDFEKAIEYFDQALALKPNDITSLKGIGRAYLGRGNRRRAEEFFTKAQVEELKKTPIEFILGWIALGAVVIGGMGFLIQHWRRKAKGKFLLCELQILRFAVSLSHQKNGKFPTALERLEGESFRMPGSKKDFAEFFFSRKGDRGFFVDPFGNRYLYNPDTGGVFSTTHGFEEK